MSDQPTSRLNSPARARRKAVTSSGALALGLAFPGWSRAQAYPARPVTMMVPYPVGGLSDVIARMVNTVIAKHLGQPVVVDNLGGASGSLAAAKVLNAPADGYLFFQGSPNELILAPLAMSSVKFKSEDFRLLQMVAVAPMAMFARKDFPPSNGDEFAAYAIEQARKGKPVTYASVGVGSFYHLLGEHMSKVLNVPMTHVAYKGGAPAQQDLIAGEVDIYLSPWGRPQLELLKQGRIKVVGTLGKERHPLMKQAPTLTESKALKGFEFDIWTGYFVRKDTPDAIANTLHKALTETLGDAGVIKTLENMGLSISKPMTLADAARAYADGTAQFRAIAKAINLQAQ